MTREEKELIERTRDTYYDAADDPDARPSERKRDRYAAEVLDDLLTALFELATRPRG